MDALKVSEPKPKSAVEIAREAGVDIYGIQAIMKLIPLERLELHDTMIRIVLDTGIEIDSENFSMNYGEIMQLRRLLMTYAPNNLLQ
jgi:hypothetical protein